MSHLRTEEKETIYGSRRLVVGVLLISLSVVLARLYFHWLLGRNAGSPFGPLSPREKNIIGLAIVVSIMNVIALLGGKQLARKMQDKSFARKFDWAYVPFFIAALYFLLPWPWWIIVAVVAIPFLLAIDSHRFRRMEHPRGGEKY